MYIQPVRVITFHKDQQRPTAVLSAKATVHWLLTHSWCVWVLLRSRGAVKSCHMISLE